MSRRWREQFERRQLHLSEAALKQAEAAVRDAQRAMRFASVVFADVSGFSALSREVHPEVMEGLINRFSAIASEEALQHNGFIVDFAGDGVLMVFGAPYSYGNDAKNAVQVAWNFVTRLRGVLRPDGKPLLARAGVASGEILSTIKEAGIHRQFSVIGPTVNLGARLEQNATPGQVLVCQTTAQLTQPYWRFEATAPLVLKNVSDGYIAHRVVEPQAAGEDREEIPFVGRHREMGLLQRLLDEPKLRIVVVTGEPGAGKSRLLRQFEQRNASRMAMTRLTGMPEGRHILLSPWLSALRERLKLRLEDDPATAVADALRAEAKRRGGGFDAEVAGYLLGVPAAIEKLARERAETLKERAFDFIATEFLTGTPERMQIVVLDDWQWCDELSAELARELIARTPSHVKFVIVHRTEERGQPLPFDSAQAEHLSILLRPLPPEEATELTLQLVEAAALPESVRRVLAARSGGNPLFVAELVRALRERLPESDVPLTEEEVERLLPASLSSLVQWRIDRLRDRVRLTLQAAAVLGYEFSRGLLAAIEQVQEGLLDNLARLHAHSFVVPLDRVTGDVLLRFYHSVIREVAYGMLLPQQRGVLHEQVARRLEAGGDAHGPEITDAIARHWEAAGRPEKALPWLAKGSARREALGAFGEAIDWSTRALAMIRGPLGNDAKFRPVAVRLLTRIGFASQAIGRYEEGERHLREGKALAEEAALRALAGECDVWLASICLRTGRLAEAGEAIERLLAESSALTPAMRDSALVAALELERERGEPAKVLALVERFRATAGTEKDWPMAAFCANAAGLAQWELGDLDRAHAEFELAVREHRRSGAMDFMMQSLGNLATVRERLGRIGAAREAFRQVRETAEKRGNRILVAAMCINGANLALHERHFAEAAEESAQALVLCETLGNPQFTAIALNNLSRSRVALGQHQAARDAAARLRRLVRPDRATLKARWLMTMLTSLEARTADRAPNYKRERAAIDSMLRRAEAIDGTVEFRCRAWLSLGEHARRAGETDAAVAAAAQSRDLARSVGYRQGEVAAERALQQLGPA